MKAAKIQEQFVVDKQGKAKAVIVRLSEYQKLLKQVEDLEDALDLKRAKRTARRLIPHDVFFRQLKARHLL